MCDVEGFDTRLGRNEGNTGGKRGSTAGSGPLHSSPPHRCIPRRPGEMPRRFPPAPAGGFVHTAAARCGSPPFDEGVGRRERQWRSMPTPHRRLRRVLAAVCLPAIASACGLFSDPSGRSYADRAVVRRTAYGVPHILAEDLGSLFYALAWCHMEDYGADITHRLVRARGELARQFGVDSLESDFWWRPRHALAEESYPGLSAAIREVFEAYAAGVNDYVASHPKEFPAMIASAFSGADVAAQWSDETLQPKVDRFLASTAASRSRADSLRVAGDGSNAWALAPSRTVSGHAILLRNPHLRWGSGPYGAYYEAHLTVPGVIDFYGDFRVGYPLYFNSGFNRYLGWATTDNSPDLEEFYELQRDPVRPDHFLFDGTSVPMQRDSVRVEVRDGTALQIAVRETWATPLGPVVEVSPDKVVVVRSSDWGRFDRAEQFLRMMQARNLEEWRAALRGRAHVESNFVYADRDGNIFYIWNAAIPVLPHEPGRDTVAIPARVAADVWHELVPFDSLPQLLNPPGGYVHNENDSFHFTNPAEPLLPPLINADWPAPSLRLRSQLAIQLLAGEGRLSLEDVVRRKHDPRMLLADRVKQELVTELMRRPLDRRTARAIDLLERWDNTARVGSRGSVLFETWWEEYSRIVEEPFRVPWSADEPLSTPRGLRDPQRAVEAFGRALGAVEDRYGRADVAWGAVHRVRMQEVDLPVSGCPSTLGCFRHLGFRDAGDGKRVAYTGDAWILAVEFGEVPRAVSVLVYGQSSRQDSPHASDQVELFASETLKPVAFTEEEIARQLVTTYRPLPASSP